MAEYQFQIYTGMRNKNVIIMPDRSGPGLTSSIVVQKGIGGKYATIGRRRKRGEKHVRDKQTKDGPQVEVKV